MEGIPTIQRPYANGLKEKIKNRSVSTATVSLVHFSEGFN